MILLFSSLFLHSGLPDWGSLKVHILDENGISFPSVHIQLENQKTHSLHKGITDKTGGAQFSGLSAGSYRVLIESSGKKPFQRSDIPIEPSVSARLEVILASSAGPARSESRLIIPDSTQFVFQTVLPEEQIRNAPSAHNIWSLVENQDLSATMNRIDVGGLWGSIPGLFSSRGGCSWTQIDYRLNGMSISDPFITGRPLFIPDFFSIQTTQLTNAAHPASILSSGGIFNIITKEGSNEIHGEASFFNINSQFQSSNISDALREEGLFESHEFNNQWEGNFQISGPVIQDRLFYFGSASVSRTNRNIAEFEEDDISSVFSGLFSLQYRYGRRSSLNFLWTGQIVNHGSFGADRDIPFSSTLRKKDYSQIVQTIWKTNIENKHFFKLGLSVTTADFNENFQESENELHSFEIFTGIPAGTAAAAGNYFRNILHLTAEGESFFATTGAEHRIRYGINTEWDYADSKQTIMGNRYLRYFGSSPLETVVFSAPIDHRETAIHIGFSLEDTIVFRNQCALLLGFHLIHSLGRAVGSQNGDSPKIQWLNIAPRMAFSLPLNRKKNAYIKLTAGRTYYSLPLSYLTYGHSGAPAGLVYQWNDSNGDGLFTENEAGELVRREGAFFASIDPDLKRPYVDEITISYSKSSASGWYFSFGGFFRETRNLIETVNTGVPFSAYEPATLFDIGDDRIFNTHDDLIFTVYNQSKDSLGQDFFLLTNNTGEKRITKYHGADLVLVKRYGEKFTFFLSLTAISAVGTTNPGNQEWENDDGVIGSLYDNPNTLINTRGRVRFDRGYTGRLGFTAAAPFGLKISCIVKYYDGQPFSRKIIVSGFNQGPFYIMAHTRGVARYEYNRTVDIRLERTFRIGPGGLRIMLDGFNIINRGLATEENEWTGPEFPLRYATEIQSPRVFRLGIAYVF